MDRVRKSQRPGADPAHSGSSGRRRRGRPGAHAAFQRHAGARLPSRPGFEAEGSPLLPQLITRDNGAQPCPLPAPSSGRGRAEGAGRRGLSGCLFVYGHRTRHWFYTPARFEVKKHFQGAGGSQLLRAQSGVLLFLVPGRAQPDLGKHQCPQGLPWGWMTGMGALPGRTRWALKGQRGGLSS